MAAPGLGLVVPAYFDSEDDYDRLVHCAMMMGDRLVVVLTKQKASPNLRSAYDRVSKRLRMLGARVVGLVETLQGTREVGPVNRDIDAWYDAIALDGVFLDNVSMAKYWHYFNIHGYCRRKAEAAGQKPPILVMDVAGAEGEMDPRYLDIAEILVVKSGAPADVDVAAYPPAVLQGDRKKFGIMVHSAPSPGPTVDSARSNNVFWVYSTNLELAANPWGHLPSYWDDLVTHCTPLQVIVPCNLNLQSDGFLLRALAQSSAAVPGGGTVVLNRATGTTSESNPNLGMFKAFIQRLRGNGTKVLAFIDSRDAGSIGQVNRDIDSWYDRYDLDGVCFGNCVMNMDNYWHYNNIQTYAHTKAAQAQQGKPIIALSLRTLSDDGVEERFLSYSDLIIVDGNSLEGADIHRPPAWLNTNISRRFGLMIPLSSRTRNQRINGAPYRHVRNIIAGAGGSANDPNSNLGIIIPAYIHYGTNVEEYNALEETAQSLGSRLIIIINPMNGPITPEGEGYQLYSDFCRRIRRTGAHVIGYVHTGYGERDVDDVQNDIAVWYQHFLIDGIFFDESVMNKFWRYKQLQGYCKRRAGMKDRGEPLVVLNPGIVGETADPRYIEIADIIVVFEEADSSLASFSATSWMYSADRKKFGIMVHSASSPGPTVDSARSNNVFWVYSTNLELAANPWGHLPSYWDDIVDEATPSRTGSEE